MKWCFLVLIISAIYRINSRSNNNYYDGTILKFGETATIQHSIVNVWCVSKDPFLRQHIIYIEKNLIKSLSLDDPSGHTVAGTGEVGYRNGFVDEAIFGENVYDLLHYRTDYVLLADTENHVIRYMNRITGVIGLHSGKPNKTGHKDGEFQDTQFNRPYCLRHTGDMEVISVCDFGNSAIRLIDFRSQTSTSVITDLPGNPVGIEFLQTTAYVSLYKKSILVVDLMTYETRTLIAVNRLTSSGPFDESGLFNVGSVLALTDFMLLVSDTTGSRIRVIDMDAEVMQDICDGRTRLKDGPIFACSLPAVHSLYYQSGQLWIGHQQGVSMIPLEMTSESLENSKLNSSENGTQPDTGKSFVIGARKGMTGLEVGVLVFGILFGLLCIMAIAYCMTKRAPQPETALHSRQAGTSHTSVPSDKTEQNQSSIELKESVHQSRKTVEATIENSN